MYLKSLSHLDKTYVESLDVILVSDSFYNLFSLYFNKDNYTVNRIIVDECNSIKVSNLIEIKSIFAWFITSSINSLMSNTGYVNTSVSYVGANQTYYNRERSIMSTGYILNTINKIYDRQKENANIFLINNPEYIAQSILLPELITIILICKDNAIIKVLNGIVSHDILSMLNAGDIDGIIKKLDVVVGDETSIIRIITQKYRDELILKEYELKVAIESPNYRISNEPPSINNKRTAISDLKYKIDCIGNRVKTVENCPICLDDYNNPTITPCCNNKFCFNCITLTLNSKSNCPTCRADLKVSNILVLTNKTDNINDSSIQLTSNSLFINTVFDTTTPYSNNITILQSYSKELTKYENMNKIFELNQHQASKKYLIFTEYESTLNIKVTAILDKWRLKYGRIRGTSVTINKQIENYKSKDGDTNVLLVNSKFFGSGMNLENTTDIIIMHKMQKDIEMQAIGRAQRFGRVGELRVWKLYYQNESN